MTLSFLRPLLFSLLLLITGMASGQLMTAEEKGLPSNSAFHVGDIDAVNLQNGNLHISIPIANVTQRGGSSMAWGLAYDTPSWTKQWIPDYCPPVSYPIIINADIEAVKQQLLPCRPQGHYLATPSNTFNSNWRYTTPEDWDVSWTDHDEACPIPITHPSGSIQSGGSLIEYDEYSYKTNWYIYDPEGTAHPVALRTEYYVPNGATTNTDCLGSVARAPALDGSGLLLDLGPLSAGALSGLSPIQRKIAEIEGTPDGKSYTKPVFYTRSGTQHLWTGVTRDANGNLRSEISDTLGRQGVSIGYDPAYQPGDPSHGLSTPHTQSKIRMAHLRNIASTIET